MGDYVTLSALKTNMGITTTDWDALLQTAISAASQTIDGFCGRTFDAADGTETAKTFHVDDPHEIVVGDFIISEPSEFIVADDSNGDGTFENVWTQDDLQAVRSFEPWPRNPQTGWPYRRLIALNGVFPTGSRRLRVTADWGWAAIPDPVVLAAQLTARRLALPLLADAGAPVSGAVSEVSLEGSDSVKYAASVSGQTGGDSAAMAAGALGIESKAILSPYMVVDVAAVGQEDTLVLRSPDTAGQHV